MDTKKLGDVVAIRPEFFKDRLQEHIKVDLLKEQIEIHNLGLPMTLKQAEQFIRGRVDTKKLGDVVAIRPEFFKDRLQEHINVDLQSRFAYSLKTGPLFIYTGKSDICVLFRKSRPLGLSTFWFEFNFLSWYLLHAW